MLKCPLNKLLVTIEQKYQDAQGALFIDTTYHPEEYATLKGTVVSVPDHVDADIFRSKVTQLAKPGDEVWFSYAIVYDYKIQRDGETPEYKNLVTYEGQEYWKVDYGEVFCVVRDGKILIPTQHLLLEPITDDSPAITGGLFQVKKSTVYEDRAKVVAVPEIKSSVQPGDVIPIEMEFVQQYMIFNRPHYIIPVRRLIAKF